MRQNKNSRANFFDSRRRRGTRPRRDMIRVDAIEPLETRSLMTITNLAFTPPLNPVEGQNFGNVSPIATFTDSAGLNLSNFSAVLQWGDGGIDTDVLNGGTVLIMEDTLIPTQYDVYDLTGHTYQEEGTPGNIALSVTETSSIGSAPNSASISQPITITDAPLSATNVGTIHPTEGQAFTGTLATFTDTDPNGVLGEYAANINWGDGQSSVGVITQPGGAGHAFVVTGTHTFAEEGTFSASNTPPNPVSVTIVDTDGHNPPAGTRATATVTDTAIVGDATLTPLPLTTPFTSTEGSAGTGVVATFSDANPSAPVTDFSGTVNWGDGQTSAFSSANIQVVSRSATQAIFNVQGLTHTYAEAGSPTISVKINDIGGSSTTSTSQATVNDAKLLASGTTISGAVEGTNGTFKVATLIDYNPNAPTSDFSGTINWGDGQTSAFGPGDVTLVARGTSVSVFTISGSHAFVEDGDYNTANGNPISVSINDVDGSTTSATSSATVADAALHASSTIGSTVEQGTFSGTVATFTDADQFGQIGDYTVSINWGDSSTPTAGVVTQPGGPGHAFVVSGSHLYAEEGSYNVTVQITDTDQHLPAVPGVARSSATLTTPTVITVSDAPLSPGPAVSPQPIIAYAGLPAGSPPNGQLMAIFNDTNAKGTLSDFPLGSQIINWGDGTTSTATDVTQPGGVGTAFYVYGMHTYNPTMALPVTYNASVSINDVGGQSLSISDQVKVEVAPLLATPIPINTTEGVALTNVEVATFVNANPNPPAGTTYSGTINWGDPYNGFSSAASIVADPYVAGQYDVYGTYTHGYTEAGIFSATVSLSSSQGATGSANVKATVQDAALTGSPVTFKPTEGLSFTGTVGTFTDADPYSAASDYAITIHWGDGQTSSGTAVPDPNPAVGYDITGTHTYAEEGTYTGVTISISENDLPTPPPVTPASTTIYNSTAIVQDAPLTITSMPSMSTVEGKAFPDAFPTQYPGLGALVATFTDANPIPGNATPPDASDYNATVVWSGTLSNPIIATPGTVVADPNVPGQFDVLANYTYPEDGVYSPTVLIGDIGGSTAIQTGSNEVTVKDAALHPVSTPANLSVEGATFTGVVGSFTDDDPHGLPGANGDYTAVINWGDGQTSDGTITQPGGPGTAFQVIGTHAYTEDGVFNQPNGNAVTVTVTDTDQHLTSTPAVPRSTVTLHSAMTVSDAPLMAVANPSLPAATEGALYAPVAPLATFTDADPNGQTGDYTATITWGDGQTSTGTVAADPNIAGQFDVTGSHLFVEDGVFSGTSTPPFSVTITDTDQHLSSTPAVPRATVTVNPTVVVNDAPLSSTATTIAAQTEGNTFTVEIGTFTDADPNGQFGDYTVTISWGDGATSTGSLTQPGGPNTPFVVSGTHTYAEERPNGSLSGPGSLPYQVTAQITDTDQHLGTPPSVPRSTTSIVNTIAVNDAAISLTPTTGTTVTEGSSSSITLATLVDGDKGGNPGDYAGTVTWGDGSTSALSASNFVPVLDGNGHPIPGHFYVEATHNYTEESLHQPTGKFVASVQVWDTDGIRPTSGSTVTATASPAILVNDAALTSTGTAQTFTSTEGASTGSIGVATFQDANTSALNEVPPSPGADYTAVINWGDGSTSAGSVQPANNAGLFNVYGTHTYTGENTAGYQVSVTITDDGGQSTVANNTTVIVKDASLTGLNPPTYPSTNIPLTTGVNSNAISVGQFVDADPNGGVSDYTATIYWGDGSSSAASNFVTSPSPIGDPPGTLVNVIGSHTYARKGSYRILVLAYDSDGGPTAGTPFAVIYNSTAIVTDPPSGTTSISLTSRTIGVSPLVQTTASTTPRTTTTSPTAVVDAALSAIVAQGTTVGQDGSSALGVQKKSLALIG